MRISKINKLFPNYFFSIFLFFSILLGYFLLLEGLLYINIIKILFFAMVLFFLLIIYNRYDPLSIQEKKIIVLYLTYFIFLFLISLIYYFNQPVTLIIEASVYFMKVNMWLGIFFLIFHNKFYNVKYIIYLLILMGVIFSLSSIVNFLSSDLNLINISRYLIDLPRHPRQQFETVGVFGFYHPERTSYYFSEAAKFAQFLFGPLFLCIGLYKITLKKKYLLCFLLFLATIIITNTLFAYITLIIMIPIVFLFNRGAFTTTFIIILTIAFVFFASGALGVLAENPEIEGSEYLTKTFAKSSSINSKTAEYQTITDILKNNWLGVQGVFRAPYSIVSSEYAAQSGGFAVGFFDDLARGGIIGLTFRGLILCTVIILFRRKHRDNKAIMFKYCTFAYISLIIMSIGYGPFDIYQNLFYLALTVYLYNKEDDSLGFGFKI